MLYKLNPSSVVRTLHGGGGGKRMADVDVA